MAELCPRLVRVGVVETSVVDVRVELDPHDVVTRVDLLLCAQQVDEAARRDEQLRAEGARVEPLGPSHPLLVGLAGYLRGESPLPAWPVQPEGTEFQRAVWGALQAVPAGATVSYGELARRVGRPRAVRAVGQANRRNPIPLLVPCHRAVGADGAMVGFSGPGDAGLRVKRLLLQLEGALPQELPLA